MYHVGAVQPYYTLERVIDMDWKTVAAAFIIATAAVTAIDAPVAAGETPVPRVTWQMSQDASSGEIMIGPEVVIRIRRELGGYTIGMRAQAVVERTAQAGKAADLVRPVRLDGGSAAVSANGRIVVMVDEQTASANGTTSWRLATEWANNIRKSFGVEPSVWTDPLAEGRYVGTGIASWYGWEFEGLRTSSGERFRCEQLTAAHKTLPFGTIVRVTRLDNGRTVKVRINDRGPFIAGRIIDLSRQAAQVIGMLGEGLATVELRVVKAQS